jgi:hypothetical protein
MAIATGSGTQPVSSFFFSVSSFLVDSLVAHDHVVMTTAPPLAGEKTMHASAEQPSTCMSTIQLSLHISIVEASATMQTPNGEQNISMHC